MHDLFKDNRTGEIVMLEKVIDAHTYIVRGRKTRYMVNPKDLTRIKLTAKNSAKGVD